MFKALRHVAIRRLWFGQALSSIGDEIYRVGLTWLAVGLIGADTGFLNAAQAASLMILSFVGGRWADRWDPLRTMVYVDLARAGIVFVPVLLSYFFPVSMPVLWVMAISLSGLSAFFDPALQSTLPRFSPSVPILRSTTGLMSTTARLARMVGPSIVGFLAGVIPILQFFSLDAVSFLFSALCVLSITQLAPPLEHVQQTGKLRRISFYEAILSGFRSVKKERGMLPILWLKGITGGTWILAQTLGMALLVHEVAPGDTLAFGMLIAAYGVGNFAGALIFGNRQRRKSELYMFWGYIWLGVGFFGVGVAPNLRLSMLAAAFGGFGGPMNDLAFIDMVQKRFPLGEMTRIFRLRMAVETSAALVLMLLSPWLFRVFHAGPIIAACGITWIACGILGLVWKPWLPHES